MEDINMNRYDALDEVTIGELIKAMNDTDKLLTLVNEIAMNKYDLGFEDGYDIGETSGYADGWSDAQED